jgi:hypothetical protein
MLVLACSDWNGKTIERRKAEDSDTATVQRDLSKVSESKSGNIWEKIKVQSSLEIKLSVDHRFCYKLENHT